MTSSVDTVTLRALLATIISQADEDTPRLQYADVLMDSDDVLDRALGEYIKLSIELCNHKKLVKPRIDTSLKKIDFNRDDGYKGVDSYDWYRKGIDLSERSNTIWKQVRWHEFYNNYYVQNKEFSFEVSRGFISSITCTATQFLAVCDKLVWHESMVHTSKVKQLSPYTGRWWECPLTAHPVREIEIVDSGMLDNVSATRMNQWEDRCKKYGINLTEVYDN